MSSSNSESNEMSQQDNDAFEASAPGSVQSPPSIQRQSSPRTPHGTPRATLRANPSLHQHATTPQSPRIPTRTPLRRPGLFRQDTRPANRQLHQHATTPQSARTPRTANEENELRPAPVPDTNRDPLHHAIYRIMHRYMPLNQRDVERLDPQVQREVERLIRNSRADPNHKFENERASAYAARWNLTRTSDYLKRQEHDGRQSDDIVRSLEGRFNQTTEETNRTIAG